jgi:hypothetical protein
MDPPTFIYNAAPDANQDIRLLGLEWNEERNKLEGRLKIMRLRLSIGNEALSYTWNGEKPSVPIICEEKSPLKVCASCHRRGVYGLTHALI